MTKILRVQIPESTRQRYVHPPVVDESCVVLADVEIPFHNADFCQRVIKLAVTHNIKYVLLAGDFLHWESFSSFVAGNKDSQEEIEEIQEYVESFVKPFKRGVWLSGNHDMRPQRLLDRMISAEFISRMVIKPEFANEFFGKIQVSDYYYCNVGKEWEVHHPHATSAVPASAALKIAIRQNKNIAMAHNHLFGEVMTPDGRHIAIDIGTCNDSARLAYTALRASARPLMANGALLLWKRDGKFSHRHLADKLTDWDYEFYTARKAPLCRG